MGTTGVEGGLNHASSGQGARKQACRYKRRTTHLYHKIAQQRGVRLDAVALVIIIGQVQQFPLQICPLALHRL